VDFLSTAKDAISVIGLLAAGYFFLLRRELYPRAQFDLSMRLLGERDDELLLEVGATVKNIGIVRHSIKLFTYSLRGLDIGSPWVENADKLNRNQFSWTVAKWRLGSRGIHYGHRARHRATILFHRKSLACQC
jgi:hypothetical protein